jgi:ATP-dependent Clp protease ATP-binding subunit ClpB
MDAKEISHGFLIRGADYLESHRDFKLVGRDLELKRLSRILMRSKANSVLLVGPGGAGCTALCLGLEGSRKDPGTPFDIVNKRLFWLDTDGLFSSGNATTLNENFEKVLRQLSRYPDTLLVIEDMRDFVDATRNSGCTHFINALMRAVDGHKFQAIFESRDSDLEVVLKCHSNMAELYTMLDLAEPDAESLRQIVREAVKALERHHNLPVDDEAVDAAIELTTKYRVRESSLSRAQPERSLNLLDRALTAYREQAHTKPRGLASKLAELAEAVGALERNEKPAALAGKDRKSLEALRVELGASITTIETAWKETQATLKKLHRSQTDGEEMIRSLEDQLEDQRKREAESRAAHEQEESAKPKEFKSFSMRAAAGGYESEEVNRIKVEIDKVQAAVQREKAAFASLTAKINEGLRLKAEHVLTEFSQLSGIPANKLNQDERAKLLGLDETLAARVFGQDHVVSKLADAVRVARVGLKDPQKPQASFMFLGPSGVGKTELAKTLAAALHDDERALLRFDMSEYMEKHAVAKLIGAPPGYEGYEAGGILTNAMRRNPYVVILFDEIEKAHQDVFNVFLQVLDDGRLTDNRGLTVSFSEAIIIMTTNIGQSHFLNPALAFDDAAAETIKELDVHYRPEFLNRFNGRQNIVCFRSLGLPVIERIARREIDKLNERVRGQGRDLKILLSDESLAALCKDQYVPANGARGIPGYFATNIHPAVANAILETQSLCGTMEVLYDSAARKLSIRPLDTDHSPPTANRKQAVRDQRTGQ